MKSLDEVLKEMKRDSKKKELDVTNALEDHGENSREFMYSKGWYECLECWIGMIEQNLRQRKSK